MSDILSKHIPERCYPCPPSSIKFKTTFKNCVLKALKHRGWKEVENDGCWDIYWADKEPVQELLNRTHLGQNQRVNHFRNNYEITRKDLLMRNLKKYKRQLEKDGMTDEAAQFDFFPMTYNLPSEYAIFADEFKRSGNSVWIMKPIGKCQGKGIFLFNKLNQIANWSNNRVDGHPQAENYVVQKYISNPLLIGGKKFDMRLYCLVTSYSPLTVYFYRDGFARFTHHRYSNNVHLTNVAIQKTSENYDKNLGGKWDLRTLKQYLISKYGNGKVDTCFTKIQDLILKTLQSVQKIMINDKHCFELYGFDVLLDDALKPWLIEVNGSPSMTANTTRDTQLKTDLLDDVFNIINMEKILTGKETKVGGFDLICRGTPMAVSEPNSLIRSMLGCTDDRARGYTMIAREALFHLNGNKKGESSQLKISKCASRTRHTDIYETQASQPSTMASLDEDSTAAKTMLIGRYTSFADSFLEDASCLSAYNSKLLKLGSKTTSKPSLTDLNLSESSIEPKLAKKFRKRSKYTRNSISICSTKMDIPEETSAKMTPKKKKQPKFRALSKQVSIKEQDDTSDLDVLDNTTPPRGQTRLEPIRLFPVKALNNQCAIKLPALLMPSKNRLELPPISATHIVLPVDTSTLPTEESQGNDATADVKGSLSLIRSFRTGSVLRMKKGQVKLEAIRSRRYSDQVKDSLSTMGKTLLDSVNIFKVDRDLSVEKSTKENEGARSYALETPGKSFKSRINTTRRLSLKQKLITQKV